MFSASFKGNQETSLIHQKMIEALCFCIPQRSGRKSEKKKRQEKMFICLSLVLFCFLQFSFVSFPIFHLSVKDVRKQSFFIVIRAISDSLILQHFLSQYILFSFGDSNYTWFVIITSKGVPECSAIVQSVLFFSALRGWFGKQLLKLSSTS